MRIGHFQNVPFLNRVENPIESALELLATKSSQPVATGAGPKAGEDRAIPNEKSMPNLYQGQTNGCGTTSLAMIMSYLGVPETQADVDSAIRRTNSFTSPTDILEFARSKGLEAEGYNHGSLDELKSFIDQGIPCQALIDVSGDGNPAKMHYVAVVGYGKNPDGSSYVRIHNPATGATVNMPEAEFEKQWSSTPLGFDHYFNAFAPGGTELPASRFDGIQGSLAAADGLANVTNNFDRLIHPGSVGEFIHGAVGLAGGISETIGGAIGAGIELGADWVKKSTKDIPILGAVVAPLADIVHGAGAAIGDLNRGLGSALDDAGGAFEALFRGDAGGFFGGLGNAVGDIFGGVVNAAGDLLNGVFTAAGDIFTSITDGVNGAVGALNDAVETIGGAVGDAADAVGDAVGDAAHAVEDAANDVARAAEEAANAAAKAAEDAANAVAKAAEDAAKAAAKAVEDAANAAAKAAEDAANAAANAVNDIGNAIGDFFGI